MLAAKKPNLILSFFLSLSIIISFQRSKISDWTNFIIIFLVTYITSFLKLLKGNLLLFVFIVIIASFKLYKKMLNNLKLIRNIR